MFTSLKVSRTVYAVNNFNNVVKHMNIQQFLKLCEPNDARR